MRFDPDAFHGKMQPGKSMLSVDHQILALRFAQMADGIRAVCLLKAKRFIGKEKHGARNHWLGDDGFIKIDDLLNLLAIQDTLKSFFASLDSRNELRYLIVFRELGLLDLLTLEIVPAGKPNLVQEFTRLISDKIEHALLLRDPRREHTNLLGYRKLGRRFYAALSMAARRTTVLRSYNDVFKMVHVFCLHLAHAAYPGATLWCQCTGTGRFTGHDGTLM
ncbi:MAG: hypothetical protein HC938_02450 [Nitrospira sp.]|nr:hypothetical protein [Nitrospira sp.]